MLEEKMAESQRIEEENDSVRNAIPADCNQELVKITASIVMVVAVSLSLYQLYTAGIAALTAMVQRSIHLGANRKRIRK